MFWHTLNAVEDLDPDFVFIENVPKFLKMKFQYSKMDLTFEEILNEKFSDKYIVESQILNAKDYGVPQSRPRAIINSTKKSTCGLGLKRRTK